MAVFKPPYATSEERKTVTLEDGELMFDSTEKAFYTGDGTPGGRAINETTITIRNCEVLPSGSQASFEETEDSTAQARIYTFYYPEAPDSISIPSPLLSNEEAVTPASGKVTPFLRAGENGSVELAVKKRGRHHPSGLQRRKRLLFDRSCGLHRGQCAILHGPSGRHRSRRQQFLGRRCGRSSSPRLGSSRDRIIRRPEPSIFPLIRTSS